MSVQPVPTYNEDDKQRLIVLERMVQRLHATNRIAIVVLYTLATGCLFHLHRHYYLLPGERFRLLNQSSILCG